MQVDIQGNTQKHINFIKIVALSSIGLCLLAFFVGIAWSFIFGVFLGLASVVSFLAAIYGVTKHSSAKGLLVNFFIIVLIFIIFIASSMEFRVNLDMVRYMAYKLSYFSPYAIIFLFMFACVIFIPFKNLHDELARVTSQKTFIYAFWCYPIEFFLLIAFSFFVRIHYEMIYRLEFVALFLLFINAIFYTIAWGGIKKLSCEPKECQKYQTYKGNLAFVKILFALVGILFVCNVLPVFRYYMGIFSIMVAFIGLIACVLLAKNTKKWLLVLYWVLLYLPSFTSLVYYVSYAEWFFVILNVVAILFYLHLSKITQVEPFKMIGYIYAGLFFITILLAIVLGDINFAFSTPTMFQLVALKDLLVGVLFILGALMMKKDKMSF
ncbi:hypothetical protein B6S12_05315 [Helicobacter valdiviensis]|uniref:Uncharacterized protein n=1 Tax=Helicobacter valdiviensis TaxID=1458358 RepID=A0A2W6NGN7_9HELI|nr:hypothetical protein [Helicobacter valdiviensis]PZT48140.1 hypothetical protein B6S12_05315 [Helicobacter valdiviensis]